MTTIIALRHGESMANEINAFAGHLDIDLTLKGYEQAKRAGIYLKENFNISKIYASPLKRAFNTGYECAKILNKEIIKDDNLKEINAGSWEGLTFSELDEKFTDDFYMWKHDIGNSAPTGGESVKSLYERAILEFNKIAKENPSKEVLIATHATPIRAMITYIKKGDYKKMNEIPWPTNASVSIFTYDDGKWDIKDVSINSYLGDIATKVSLNV